MRPPMPTLVAHDRPATSDPRGWPPSSGRNRAAAATPAEPFAFRIRWLQSSVAADAQALDVAAFGRGFERANFQIGDAHCQRRKLVLVEYEALLERFELGF